MVSHSHMQTSIINQQILVLEKSDDPLWLGLASGSLTYLPTSTRLF